MSRRLLARALGLGAGLGLAGCVDNLAICIDSGAAIVVQVNDAVTGTSLTDGARGVISDGTYSDSLRPEADGSRQVLAAGAGRPGRYDVTVVHPGYQPWHASDIVVGSTACGLSGQVLEVGLTPEP